MESRVCFLLRPYLSLLILLSDAEESGQSGISLLDVVKDVNSSVVDREDVLADSVYYFDRNAGTFGICS